MMCSTPILGLINVFFWNFLVLWILWNFVFQKYLNASSQDFCHKLQKKKKIGFGVGVISCDFWACFLKSALYRAM